MSGLVLLVIPYMAFMSRSCGGKPSIPFGLAQFLCASPYLLLWPVLGWWNLLGYTGAVVGLRMAHGRGFNYNLPFKIGSKPEVIEKLIPQWLPVFWQKFLIMLLTGLSVPLLYCILLLSIHEFLSALVLLVSGSFKALCYLSGSTERAEYYRGLALGLGLVLSIYSITFFQM